MFTGIVEGVGTIRTADRCASAVRFVIEPPVPWPEVAIGASVAVDGVCLTVEARVGTVIYALNDPNGIAGGGAGRP